MLQYINRLTIPYNNIAILLDLSDTNNVLIEIIKINNVFHFTDRHFKMKDNEEYNIFFGNRNNYHPKD